MNLLNRERIQILTEQLLKGTDCQSDLIMEHYGYVKSGASFMSKFYPYWRDEIISVALYALVEAVNGYRESYNPEKGNNITAYIVSYYRYSVMNYTKKEKTSEHSEINESTSVTYNNPRETVTIHESFTNLSLNDREAIVLDYMLQEYNYQNIADELGTTRQYIHEVATRLRQRIKTKITEDVNIAKLGGYKNVRKLRRVATYA